MNEHLSNALTLAEEGSLAGAEAAFRQVLAAEPFHVEATIGLALALRGLERPDEAMTLLHETLGHARNGEVLALLVELRIATGEFAHARAWLDEAIALAPDEPRGYVVRAQLAAKDDDVVLADTLLRKGIKRGAVLPPDYVVSLYQAFARQMAAEERLEEASALVWRAFKVFDDNVHLCILAAGVAEAAQDTEVAVDRYRVATDLLEDGPLRREIIGKLTDLLNL